MSWKYQTYLQSMQYSWDAAPVQGKTFDDLDLQKIEKFLDKVNTAGRFYLEGPAYERLEKLNLIKNREVTNAARLLFAKDGVTHKVRLASYKDDSATSGENLYATTLFELAEEVMGYLVSQMKIVPDENAPPHLHREILEYPLSALRETVLNTLIHRDYTSPDDIQIHVQSRKITFYNPGGLYGSSTINDLQRDNYQSYARNKLITEAFYLAGDIEKYGSGFIRIRRELKKYPTMKMEFENIPNGFLVTYSYTQQKTSTAGDEKTPEKIAPKGPPKKIADKVHGTLSVNQKKIIAEMQKNPTVSMSELGKMTGISKRKILDNINRLKSFGLVCRQGNNKTGYWKTSQ